MIECQIKAKAMHYGCSMWFVCSELQLPLFYDMLIEVALCLVCYSVWLIDPVSQYTNITMTDWILFLSEER